MFPIHTCVDESLLNCYTRDLRQSAKFSGPLYAITLNDVRQTCHHWLFGIVLMDAIICYLSVSMILLCTICAIVSMNLNFTTRTRLI